MSHQTYPDGTDPHTIPLDVPYKTPPAGQTSNFDHPDVTLRNTIIVTATVTLAFALLASLARFCTRIFIVRRVGWDDYICFIAAAIVVAFNAASLERIHYGLGVPTWDQRMRYYLLFDQNPFVYWFSVMTVLRHFGLMLLKLSILALYLRIMGDARDVHLKTRYITIAAMIWVVGYNFGLLGWLLSLCDPPHKFFYPQIAGNCKYSGVWKELSAWSALNVFTDFLIFALPLPLIYKLQMPLSQKIGVVLTLATALMVCAATIVNLIISVKIIKQESTEDPLQLWAIIEMNIGLICICLPAMKQLLTRGVPLFSKQYPDRVTYGSSRKRSEPNTDASKATTPGGVRRSLLDIDLDANSTTDIRLTHELTEFDERDASISNNTGNEHDRKVYKNEIQDNNVGEPSIKTKDSFDRGLGPYVHAQWMLAK